MEDATRGLVLPTTTTGSLPRPSWFVARSDGRPFRLALSDAAYHEQYTDSLAALLRDQERAGLDLLTDGDNRLDPVVGGSSWSAYPGERLDGVAPVPESRAEARSTPGTIFHEIDETAYASVVVGDVGRGGLEYTPLWKATQRLTTRPVKFGTPSAEVIWHNLVDRHYGDGERLVMDVAAALNEELLELAEAGCRAIQIDAPWVARAVARAREDVRPPEFYARIFERTVQGLQERTEVWAHMCWGNAAAQRRGGGELRFGPSMALLDELSCDVITFENADNGSRHLEEICTGIKEKKVAVGVVSHRSLQIEEPEEIAAVLRRALEYLPPERLVVTSDCGFGREGMGRRVALHKMVNMVLGTNVVRRELGVPESPCLAADPRYSLVGPARSHGAG